MLWCSLNNSALTCSSFSLEKDQSLVLMAFKKAEVNRQTKGNSLRKPSDARYSTSVCVPLWVADELLDVAYDPFSHALLQHHRAEGSASPREPKRPPLGSHGRVHDRAPFLLLQSQFSRWKTQLKAVTTGQASKTVPCLVASLWFKLPSCKMLKKICLSLPRAVKVTDSQGVPVCRSTICFSLVRSTLIHFLPYLQTNKMY